MTHSWHCRNDEPDRIMSAFIPILTDLAQKKVMDEHTLRIRESIAEARSRPGAVKLDTDAVLSDLEYLLGQNAELEVANAIVLVAKDRLTSEAREAGKISATHAVTIMGLTGQINNAMNALNTAGVQDLSGRLELRTAGRIAVLANERKDARAGLALAQELRKAAERNLDAAKAIITETHEALNAAKVPAGDGTLLGRVEKALDERAGRPLRPSGTRSFASAAALMTRQLHGYNGGR